MGALEEGGKALGNITEALKSSPIMLTILVINCAVIGFLFFSEIKQGERASEVRTLFDTMLQRCLMQRGKQEEPQLPPATSGGN
jgi:hypothetical protein